MNLLLKFLFLTLITALFSGCFALHRHHRDHDRGIKEKRETTKRNSSTTNTKRYEQ